MLSFTENHTITTTTTPSSSCTIPPPPQLINPTKQPTTVTHTSCGPPLGDQPEVDLPHPLPNFSIRDYVLAARSKDIKKNWPFSLKSLHLCLKHGVKDVLPPFQSLDDVRNQPVETFTVGTRSFEKHSVENSEKEKPSRPDSNHAALPDSSNNAPSDDRKLAETCLYNSSCQSGLESDFVLTRTGLSQSEIDSVIPDHGHSKSLPLKSGTPLKVASAEVEALGPRATNKNERTSRPLGKKCRLIVKFGGNSDRSSTEDIASNCTTSAVVSESMASKVCPVCKTFSSSSNTTLNAHIDQCLSKESTPEWMCGLKLTRHRIKPRKTRLMTDIYATAQRCTLEDLDRRNGTSWSLPTCESENKGTSNDAKKQKLFPVHPKDADNIGLVYVDANGTKVRILSNLNGPSPLGLKEGNDIGAKRPLKGSKYMSKKKKKKQFAHKHQKYLRLVPQSQKCFSHKVEGSQIIGGQKACNRKETNDEVDVRVVQRNKLADSGSFGPWLHSKQRGCTKKIIRQGSPHLLIENDRSLSGGSPELENHAHQRIADTSVNALLSSGSNQRKERLHHKEARFYDMGEHDPKRKIVGSRSVAATTSGNNTDHVGMNCSPRVSPSVGSKLSRSSHAILTKAKRFSSLRRNILSAGGRLLPNESGQTEAKNWPDFRGSSLRGTRRRDIGAAAHHSDGDHEHVVSDDRNENQFKRGAGCVGVSRVKTTVSDARKRRGFLRPSKRDDASAFKRSIEKGNYVNSWVRVGHGVHHRQVCDEDLVMESSLWTYDGRNTTNLSKFVDSHFSVPTHSFRLQSNSLQAIECDGGRQLGSEALAVPTEPHIVNDHHIFSGDEVENSLLGRSNDLPVEFGSEAGCGNVFLEVDPIPIPSPPGSYLPSPRDMGSEDFQGNSSLTTSQVHSSPDPPDVVDGDSSDSTVYLASTISNAMQGTSDPKYCEPVPVVRPIGFEDWTMSGSSGSAVASIDPSIQKSCATLRVTSTAAEGPCFVGEYSMPNNVSAVKESLVFKNDQPCCCQRKERFSQGVGLYYQESQLLRRRMMPPLSIPTAEMQVGCDANARHPKLDRRLELVPPQIVKIPAGLHPLNNPPNVGARSLGPPDRGSASPSASNPILRLMGKNLMVVNKDEDDSTTVGHQTCQLLPAYSIASPANNPSQNRHAFHHAVSQRVYSEDRHSAGEYFDVGLSGGSGRHPDPKSPQELVRLPAITYRGQHTDYSFAANVEPCEHTGDYYSLSTSLPVKEIIVIDDSAENETDVVNDGVKHAEGWRRLPAQSAAAAAAAASSATPITNMPTFNPSRVYPFSCYQSPNCPARSESAADVKNVSFRGMPSTSVSDTNTTVRWGCSVDGSDPTQRATYTSSSSSSAGLLRSPTVYYSQGYS